MSSLDELVAKLNDSDEAERIYSAEDIGYLNDQAGVPALVTRLAVEPSRAVRRAIFLALIRIEGDAPIEGATRLLGGDDPEIRNQAVDVLRHKAELAIPFLATVMREGDKDQRKLVLDVLSGIRTSEAGEIYAAALTDEDTNVVITAVEILGRARAEAFRCQIEDLLRPEAHPMLILACLQALACIGHASSLVAIRRLYPEHAAIPPFLLAPCLKTIAALE
jgi:HEAT repeat protein